MHCAVLCLSAQCAPTVSVGYSAAREVFVCVSLCMLLCRRCSLSAMVKCCVMVSWLQLPEALHYLADAEAGTVHVHGKSV